MTNNCIYYLCLLLYLSSCALRNGGVESCEADGSWNIFRGDAGLKAFANDSLSNKPSLMWMFRSEARTASSPVIYNGTAYWCDKRGKIYGVDAVGKQIFAFDFQTAIEASPLIIDSTLFIGRIDGFMSALSLSECDTLWNFETQGQISASPNVTIFKGQEAIVFGSYDNSLYCIDKTTGVELSRFESGYYINGAVAVQGQFFFSGGCDAWLRIFDSEKGLPADSLLLDTYLPASPALDGNECYIADHSGNVYVITTRHGKIVSHTKLVEASGNDGALTSVPALSASTLYTLSDNRSLYAIDRKTGRVRWSYLQKGASGESSPLACRNTVVCCTKTGIVSMLNYLTGELLWEYDTGEQITASPALADGRLYILTAKGTLFCFK
jgi:outer membrane protein assembly factor BamB